MLFQLHCLGLEISVLIVIEIFLKILINKDMLPDLNMYYGKMSDLVSFPRIKILSLKYFHIFR